MGVMEKVDILIVNHTRDIVREMLSEKFHLHHVSGAALMGSNPPPLDPAIRAVLTGVPPVPIGEGLMAALPNLEIIANFGAGYDAIDITAAVARGIMVTHTPGVLNEEVADLAVGLMLATIRRIPQAHNFAMSGHWSASEFPLSPSLQGRRVGLLGLGGIGLAIARRCAAFGVEIAYHTRTPRPDVPYQHIPDLLTFARAVDVLIAAIPGGETTRGLISEPVLDALGPDGVLINIGRGSVLDEAALLRVLERGGLGAAGLDVLADEPNIPKALTLRDDVVILPHIGGATHANRDRIGLLQARNILSWFAGEGPLTSVPESRRTIRPKGCWFVI